MIRPRPWSDVADWSMGILEPADGVVKWLGYVEANDPAHTRPGIRQQI